MKITDTMVDVADCHTTLYYLGQNPPAAPPLPLAPRDDYTDFYKKLAAKRKMAYTEARPGHASDALETLRPAYRNNKYWPKYLQTGYSQAAGRAWDYLMPFEATPKWFVEFPPDPKLNLRVRPSPRVLVYPFGWSAWVSLRLTGEYELADLSAFVERLFNHQDKPFRIRGEAAQFSLRDLFDRVADGVRADAFGGNATNDTDTQDLVSVVTVREKKGGGLATGKLGSAERALLRRIVKPHGPAPPPSLQGHLHERNGNPEEYVVADDYGRFIWMENLLTPGGRNFQHLGCHHNNTLVGLVQTRHMCELIEAGADLKPPLPVPLEELLLAAQQRLDKFNFRNAGLRFYLDGQAVADAVAKVKKLQENGKP